MPTISSLGVGSGLQSEAIISALMGAERKPVDLLAAETTGIKTQLSSVGKLQSLVSAMRDKAGAIGSLSLWGQTSVTSSDGTIVSGSTTSGAAPGRYSVTVSQLASAQTVTTATALASSSSELGDGTLQIELGTWNGTTFTGKGSPVSITIGSDDTSLADIRDKINDADAGVTATIVNDANGARLSIRSDATGAENGFKITATENVDDNDATTGLSVLGYDAAVADTPMALNQAAGNAKATVNGIAVESKTNTLSGVADNLTLTLTKTTASPVEVVVANDNEAVKSAINEFVTAFNELATYIKDQTKYNASTKTGGPLQGDRTTIGLQWQLRGVINQGTTASSTWSRLSEIGISMKEDGTLTTSTSKLEDALANPDELRKLLATDGTTTGASGFMDRFKDLGNAVLGEDGSLETLQTSLEDHIKRNDDRQAQMEDRLTRTEARIRAQYEALDTSMAKLNALSSYVSQQLAALG
ncbi:flagellar filament capping protein FliD [Ideonella sp. DXS29W]|uniref:Flagellar hook-associated protein 2 n=1 Tax=Ideonella lacteola TaxID=2984193 RepID=A0ABU9BXF3_9BURK